MAAAVANFRFESRSDELETGFDVVIVHFAALFMASEQESGALNSREQDPSPTSGAWMLFDLTIKLLFFFRAEELELWPEVLWLLGMGAKG